MWITQTYLTSPEPKAPLHIYFLFENYNSSQIAATEQVQKELERLSSVHPEVCILMPSRTVADRIEGQTRRNEKLWKAFVDAIPGVVVCRKPV